MTTPRPAPRWTLLPSLLLLLLALVLLLLTAGVCQAVVFLVGLNGYNQRLFEDTSENKMQESLKLFRQARVEGNKQGLGTGAPRERPTWVSLVTATEGCSGHARARPSRVLPPRRAIVRDVGALTAAFQAHRRALVPSRGCRQG